MLPVLGYKYTEVPSMSMILTEIFEKSISSTILSFVTSSLQVVTDRFCFFSTGVILVGIAHEKKTRLRFPLEHISKDQKRS